MSASGDLLAVGAPGRYNKQRDTAVYLFRREGAEWIREARIPAPENIFRFGFTVSLDGETLAVGDPETNIFIYRKLDGIWQQTHHINTDSQLMGGLALSGDILVFSLEREPFAKIYHFDGQTWSLIQTVATLGQGLSPYSVAAEHDTIAIAGYQGGRIYGRNSNGVWEVSRDVEGSFDSAAISGNRVAFGSSRRCLVKLFRQNNDVWTEEATLTGEKRSGEWPSAFGDFISLLGNTVAVGDPFKDILGPPAEYIGDDPIIEDAGAAYVYEYLDGAWQQTSRVTEERPGEFATFGKSLALTEDGLVVGRSVSGDLNINYAGAIFSFGDAPDLQLELLNETSASFTAKDRGDHGHLEFGSRALGSEPETATLHVFNRGNLPLTNLMVKITSGAENVSVDASELPSTLEPGVSGSFTVTSQPVNLGWLLSQIRVVSNDPGGFSGQVSVIAKSFFEGDRLVLSTGHLPYSGVSPSANNEVVFGETFFTGTTNTLNLRLTNLGNTDRGELSYEILEVAGGRLDTVSPNLSLLRSLDDGFLTLRYQADEAGEHEARIGILENGILRETFTLKLTIVPSRAPFDLAVEAAGLTGEQALPEATPFADGMTNLAKFAFGYDLGSPVGDGVHDPALGLLPWTSVERKSDGTTDWKLSFVPRPDSGLRYFVEKFSQEEGRYLPYEGELQQPSSFSGETTNYIVEALSSTGQSHGIYRVRVEFW